MVLFTGEEATLSLQSDAFFMLNNDINLIFRMVRNRKLYIICHLKKYNYRGDNILSEQNQNTQSSLLVLP